MGKRILKIVVAGFLLAAGGYAIWQGGKTAFFYFGPSESTLAKTGFDWSAARNGTLQDTYAVTPNYPFWSDGAAKERYIQIPPGTKIDTSEPDRWNFPEGTRIWKVFIRDDVHVETRMLFKYGVDPWDWDMAVYGAGAGGAGGRKLGLGKSDVLGTDHDIPAPGDCVSCHGSGEQRRPLGVTALQLPWADEGGVSISALSARNQLTDPPSGPYVIPGDELTRSALGYMHSNCGSCHSEGSKFVPESVRLRLDLTSTNLADPEATNAYRTTIGREPDIPGLGTTVLVEPGEPSESFLWKRMSVRDNGAWQMPPLATEEVDEQGVELIRKWIENLEP